MGTLHIGIVKAVYCVLAMHPLGRPGTAVRAAPAIERTPTVAAIKMTINRCLIAPGRSNTGRPQGVTRESGAAMARC